MLHLFFIILCSVKNLDLMMNHFIFTKRFIEINKALNNLKYQSLIQIMNLNKEVGLMVRLVHMKPNLL